jgi:hypothetical protein
VIKNPFLKKWYLENKNLPGRELVKILGVEYAQLRLTSGDLYITAEGLPFLNLLYPQNYWLDKKWFRENSRRLSGTSSVYKIKTKKIDGRQKDIVLKWNRMGQDIPGADQLDVLEGAEFNSPFEEFALVKELKRKLAQTGRKVATQKPLAIFVSAENFDLNQTGRHEHKMRQKLNQHNEILLDMRRLYAVVYEWVKGLDAHQAFNKGVISRETMKGLALDAQQIIEKAGFIVRDNKPDHVIVRPKSDKHLARSRQGETIYALVDFELLERTEKNEQDQRHLKRINYLKRQRDRFKTDREDFFHPYLKKVNHFGVDYIYGHVESVKGRLWVVGKDPYLFDYFLPERWRHFPKTKISIYSEMYHTVTKDDIHLVLQASRVGQIPDLDPFKEDEQKILAHGYNSPFEEVALAVELSAQGIPCIYPRAIYMSEYQTDISENLFDGSRYENHRRYLTPDGDPILKRNRDYIIIWGYWNGPDEKLADQDGDYLEGVVALRAYKEGLIDREIYFELLRRTREKLQKLGVEDLNLRGNHILISKDSRQKLIEDETGLPEIRLSNFEFLKKID